VGKVKWGVTGSQVDEIEPDEGFEDYDGPIPPASVYRVNVKRVTYVKFKSDNMGLKLLLIINDPKKKAYNGAPLFENIVDLPETAFKIRQWLDAVGGTGKDWDATVTDKDGIVTKMGRIKMDGLQIRVKTKMGKNEDGDRRAEVARLLPLTNASGADEDDADDDDDDAAEVPF
jgi:hypothetical protein